jgi:hypothetical protein
MAYKASIKLHKGIWAYCSYWDDIIKQCLSTTNEYATEITSQRRRFERDFRSGGDESWYGKPVPKSLEEAMQRRTYQEIGKNPDGTLKIYDKAYLELEPFLQFLEKISLGLLPKPVIVPNDKQLGSFSLERAMMLPNKTLCLWSNKHKREYTIAEGVAIKNDDDTQKIVKIKLNNEYEGKKDEEQECSLFKLKDGSEAYLTQKLARQLCLWSNTDEREYNEDEGDPVLDDEGFNVYVNIKLNNSYKDKKDEEQQCAVYKLKKDGSEVYLTDKVIIVNGEQVLAPIVLAWGSLNKKSFLYQEKLPKPNNNVRIFVLIGGNCGKTQLYWAGLCGIMAAKFLSTKGYSVRVTGVVGLASTSDKFRFNNELYNDQGYRMDLIDMKSYDEEIDSAGLLYPLADASFFRVRCFDYFVARYWLYKDTLSGHLNRSLTNNEFERVVRDKIKAYQLGKEKENTIEQEKDVLYYFIGGDDVTSIDGARRNLARIIYCAEKSNRESLMRLGYAFEPLEPSIQKEFDDMVAQYNLGSIVCNPDFEPKTPY